MKRIIDLQAWERYENFSFFKDFFNPFVSVTCNVDCRHAKTAARKEGMSFFLYYLYAVLRAFNEIPELRYRFDPDGNIVEYELIDALSPIKKRDGKGFVTMRFPYLCDRNEFMRKASVIINGSQDTPRFGAESGRGENNVVIVSAVPDLPFTSVAFTQRGPHGNDFPLVNVGMMGKDFMMPVALSVHHGFADGEHIARFYKLVQAYLDE